MKTPTSITEEDRALIKPYVILPLVLHAFERDTRVFLNLRSPDPYVDWIHAARERLCHETRLTRYEALKRGLNIYKNERTGSGIVVKFHYRGSGGEMTLENREIAEIAVSLMRKYLTFELPN
ncbi:hypothetical protein [Paenibacillus sabinae]|uniref:Uncharacterized protein n=1 Tax=Paenibacillus sabinae T27 TaxID=1268072 RepID=X4ZP62_9BACL|nr:hypothetical protein [Paenibacillus sabinae]AHV98967.1 hypothetical protein PSAB_20380 [Paenibacillus sabinae T27]